MGSPNSKTVTTNENNQTYITRNTMNIVNETVNNSVANALLLSNANCTSVQKIDQLISFRGCKVQGDLNVTGIEQKAVILVDFSCVNVFEASQDMAQTILTELVSQIQNGMDVESQNAMDTYAETEAKKGGVFAGGANAETNVKNIYDLTTVNENTTNIQNVIANNITSNFNVESVQECVTDQSIKQALDFSYCEVGGDINVNNLVQNASIETVANCLNETGVAQDITNEAANQLGVIIQNEEKITSTSDIRNTLKTIAVSTGFGGGCPSCPCPGCDSVEGCSAWCCGIYLCVCCCLFILFYIYKRMTG
jgi:hypothetical protein